METWKQEILRCYLRRKALARGTFTLTGGGTTDFYIDGRLVTTYPPGLRAITAGMMEVISRLTLFGEGTTLVSPVVSGIPIVAALSLEMDTPFVIDRGTQKAHGMGKRFEGSFNEGNHCLIIDDLITVGSTVIRTIDGLREAGRSVSDVVVVVERGEGGREALFQKDVRLHSLLTQQDLKAALEESKV